MNPPTFNPDLAYPLFPRESSPTLGFAQGSMNHPLHTPTEYYDCGIQNYSQNLLPVAQSLELSHRELAYPNSDLPVPRDMIYDNFSLEMSLLLGSKSTNPPSTSPPQLLSTHSHSYRQRDAASVEMWLELCNDKIGSICKCRWPFCSERFVYGSNNAHMHVHKHLRTKAYECTTCQTQFSSEVAARRHRDSRNKDFSCRYCSKLYSRIDYRNLHQKRCRQS